MRDGASGTLVVRLDFDASLLRNIRLCVPELSMSHPLDRVTSFDKFPVGNYEASVKATLVDGSEISFPVRLGIQADQNNIHDFTLSNPAQKVWLRPLDAAGRTLLFAELKLEGVDNSYRTVRDPRGVEYSVMPGNYKVKLMLPSLVLKTIPISIPPGISDCTFVIEDKPAARPRIQPRYPLIFPVSLKPSVGPWIPGKSINVSSSGVCVMSERQTLTEHNLQVRLFVPAAPVPLECPARVCWSREMDVDSSKMGLQLFLSEGLQTYLNNWLSQASQQ